MSTKISDEQNLNSEPNNFISDLKDKYKWGEEIMPFNPQEILNSEINHTDFEYVFEVPTQLSARTLGQRIGVVTLYGNLRAFNSEVYLRSEFPIEDWRLDGGQLSYREEALPTGNVKVQIKLGCYKDYPEHIKENIKKSVDDLFKN